MIKPRIYIAGPMKGYEEFNEDAFIRADDFLVELGFEVVNPLEIGEGFGLPREIQESPEILKRLIDFELAAVRSCDAIFLLHGWEKSQGAREELRVALDCKLEIHTEDSGDLLK